MNQSALRPSTPAMHEQIELRLKISAMCHLVRWMSAAYAVWILGTIVRFWTNVEWVIFACNMRYKTNIGGVSALQRTEAAALDVLIWLIMLGAIVGLWRLFGGFLNGSIFTVDAARRLRSVGMYGVATIVTGLVSVPIKGFIVTAHLTTKPALNDMLFFDSTTLLNLTFCTILIALGHVFKSASELASDNAGII